LSVKAPKSLCSNCSNSTAGHFRQLLSLFL